MTSEWVLNEGVTMVSACSFVETCEVCCSVAPKNNAMKGAMFYHIPGEEICPGWVVESWPSWQRIYWGTAKGTAKRTFSKVVVFLTIKEYYLELWHHMLSYSTQEVPNFTTVKLDSRSTWNHRCMLYLWWKMVSIMLMCIHMVVSLTICSCVCAYLGVHMH